MAVRKRKVLGEILKENGLITEDQLQEALKEQQKTGEKLGRVLVRRGIMSEKQLMATLQTSLGIKYVEISKINVDPEVLSLVPAHLIRSQKVLPIARNNNVLTLAMSDPLNYRAMDDVHMATGLEVDPVLVSESDLENAIWQFLSLRMDSSVEKIIDELGQDEPLLMPNAQEPKVLEVVDEAPIIRVVNAILLQAVQGRASDVHIEPSETDVRVRFRIDGMLHEILSLPRRSAGAVLSRIKIMADLDIAERRLPQDGRTRMLVEGREVDFRVSTMPTVFGEKAVLRILDKANALTEVGQLGFTPTNQQAVLAMSRRASGLILVTGPTGSGKTTTLYAIINEINSVDKNITTLEDPVEYSIPRVNHVQINPRAGLTFASGLRSILRQDPDIIMVGEIRDHETAQLAVQAALTGHLVLSTLHTNSAAGTVARLSDMGIESFLIASALTGVVAQRLVRRLCESCRQPYVLDGATASRLGIPEEAGNRFYRPVGCNRCRQVGYQGRIALHEVMQVGPLVRELINRTGVAEDEVQAVAIREGMTTMMKDGVLKARQGITSLEEVVKAVILEG